jgi:hypothetical protein
VNAEPTISSQPRTTLADRIVVGVLLCFGFVILCWFGWQALAARERFAAPTLYLVVCFAGGFAVVLGWGLFIRWRVKTGRFVHPYPLFGNAFICATGIFFPMVATAWFDVFHELPKPALDDVKDQARAAILIGVTAACGFAFWFKKTGARALVGPPAGGSAELTSQKPSSP